MKRFIYLIALIFAFTACDDDKNISETDLPVAAREFIATHFQGIGFTHAERDKSNGTITFDAKLVNGVELEFTEAGDWISVDCNLTLMPESIVELIPAGINTYLAEKHKDAKIIAIDKERGGYEIEINNYVNELIFTADGTFVRYDL